MSNGTATVEPLPGVAPYQGGKRNLARRIVQRIEAIPHRCYAEPFVGMGGVFFRRRQAAPAEVINDASRDVATLFRVLQRHYQAFLDMMRWQITTREGFNRLCRTDPETLTDLERAARFYYLQRAGFGGKVKARSFGTATTRAPGFDITRLAPQLEDLHTRLAGVIIECLSFDDFIQRYDRSETLFYLDPPYYGCETDYGAHLFGRGDFQRLADMLGAIRGRFVLSLNDVTEIRTIFAAFEMEAVPTTYTMAAKGTGKRVGELLITGGGAS